MTQTGHLVETPPSEGFSLTGKKEGQSPHAEQIRIVECRLCGTVCISARLLYPGKGRGVFAVGQAYTKEGVHLQTVSRKCHPSRITHTLKESRG